MIARYRSLRRIVTGSGRPATVVVLTAVPSTLPLPVEMANRGVGNPAATTPVWAPSNWRAASPFGAAIRNAPACSAPWS